MDCDRGPTARGERRIRARGPGPVAGSFDDAVRVPVRGVRVIGVGKVELGVGVRELNVARARAGARIAAFAGSIARGLRSPAGIVLLRRPARVRAGALALQVRPRVDRHAKRLAGRRGRVPVPAGRRSGGRRPPPTGAAAPGRRVLVGAADGAYFADPFFAGAPRAPRGFTAALPLAPRRGQRRETIGDVRDAFPDAPPNGPPQVDVARPLSRDAGQNA